MKHHFRFVATLVVCLAAYGLLLLALRWLSQPSNSLVLAGITMVVALILFVPILVRTIWRRL
jgi:hypothetical protein